MNENQGGPDPCSLTPQPRCNAASRIRRSRCHVGDCGVQYFKFSGVAFLNKYFILEIQENQSMTIKKRSCSVLVFEGMTVFSECSFLFSISEKLCMDPLFSMNLGGPKQSTCFFFILSN